MTRPAQTPEGTTTAPEKGSSVVGATRQDVPEGWRLMPVEVTEEMHVAAVKVLQRAHGLDGLPKRMLDAMLAATPDPASPAPSVEPVAWMFRLKGSDDNAWVLSWKPTASKNEEFYETRSLYTSPSPSPSQGEALDAQLTDDQITAGLRALLAMEQDEECSNEAALKAFRDAAMRKGD